MTQVTLPSGTTSWTVPGTVGANDAVISVQVECYGPGGGGGGSGDAAANHGGAGGGGGGYSRSVVPCTPAAVLTVSISAGGVGGNGNANGANGVATSFNNGQVTANGGTGGGYGGATQHGGAGGTPGTGQHTFAGGTGSNSNTLGATGGGGGAGAGTNGNANSTTTITGATGAASGGTGGNGGATHTAGNNGALPGGGAGGAGEANNNNANGFHAGGTGGAGQIVLTYNTVAQSVAQDAAVDQVAQQLQSYFLKSDWQIEDTQVYPQYPFLKPFPSDDSFDQAPYEQSYFSESDWQVEDINWGLNIGPVGGAGTNLMGFRGFWSLRAGMGSDFENWGYNLPVVVIITPFDDVDQVIPQQVDQYITEIETEIDNQPPAIGLIQEDASYRDIPRQTLYPCIQQVEDEQVYPQHPFLIPIEYDDSLEASRMQLEYFAETDWQIEDTQPYPKPPFLTSFPSDDSLEQYAVGWKALDQVEEFAFNIPEVIGELLLDSELQLNNEPYPDIQQVEDEQIYPQHPFLTPAWYDDSLEYYAVARSALDQIEEFAFNVPEVLAELLIEEEVQLPNPSYALIQQMEDEQFAYNPVIVTPITSFDDDQYVISTRLALHQVEEEQIFLISYAESQEFGPAQQRSIKPEIEDEMFNWGLLSPVVGGVGTNLMGFRGFWSLRAAMGSEVDNWEYKPPVITTVYVAYEDDFNFPTYRLIESDNESEQVYPASPFLTSFPSDDSLEQYATSWVVRDDVETFGFNVPEVIGELLLDESQIDNQLYPDIQQVEDEQFGQHAPFLIPTPFDDSLEQLPLGWIVRLQIEDEQFGQHSPFLTPFPSDDSLEQMNTFYLVRDDIDVQNFIEVFIQDDQVQPLQFVFYYQEEEIWGYNLIGVVPVLSYDADFNPTMQQSYYFKSLEDEMFNWGYKPPVTLVAEDDAPYDSRVVQWQALDDDTNWGFNPPEILGELILDEELQMQNLPYPATYQVENDQVYPRAPFLTAIGFDDSPEQIPTPYLIRDDVDQQNFIEAFIQDDQPQSFPVLLRYQDDEQFSYNPAVVVVINAFDAEMNPALYLKLTPEIEDELVQFGYSPLLHLIEDDAPYDSFVKQWQGVDDDTSWGYLVSQEFAVDDSSEHRVVKWKALDQIEEFAFNPPEIIGELLLDGAQLGNPPYPLIQQQEDEQFGQHPPFLTPTSEVWELMGLPPNLPYPTTYQVELDAIGQNPPFVVEIGTDDAEGQYLTPPIITDDVDVFGYQFPIPYPSIIQDDDQVPQFPFWSLAWVEGEEVQIIIPPLIVPIVYRVGMGLLLTMQCSTVPAMSVYGAESDLRLAMECSAAPLMSVYDTDSSLRMSVQSIENHGPTTPYWNNS